MNSSEMLRGVGWELVTDTAGEPVAPNCPEISVTNYQITPRNIPEEHTPHLHCGGSLKSRNFKTI